MKSPRRDFVRGALATVSGVLASPLHGAEGFAPRLGYAAITWGTFFGTLNLVLAIGNLVPLYQQDGWKTGMVIFRRQFGRPSPLVEWTFTISGGLMGLIFLSRSFFSF